MSTRLLLHLSHNNWAPFSELWFTTMSDDTPEVNNAAKALLRQGDEKTLNIYTVG